MKPEVRKPFSKEIIHIDDIEQVCNHIVPNLKKNVTKNLQRNGTIVGISGGIDSSVCLALSAKAYGAKNVLGIMLPEQDSSDDSRQLAEQLAATYGVSTLVEDITKALDGFGCYERRDEAILRVIPDFDKKVDKAKIEIKQNIAENIPAIFSITVIKPNEIGRAHV